MDPITTASIASKVVPIGRREGRKLKRANEVQNLFQAVAKSLSGDHRVPGKYKREVMKKVKGLPLNPNLGGCLKALLEGDSSVLPATEGLASQLLQFRDEVDDRAVVLAFMQAVRANVIPAKRDVPSALSTIYREQLVGNEMLADVKSQVDQGTAEVREAERRIIGEIRSQQRQEGASAFSLITGGVTFGPQTPKVLKDLGETDSAVAEEAGRALAEGGGPAFAKWVSDRAAYIAERSVETNAHVGRLLMAEDQFSAAERQFVATAEKDQEDPARQWVRAANAALHDDRSSRHQELLDKARSQDKEHPALLLAEVQSGQLSPMEVRERLDGVKPRTDADGLGLASEWAQLALLDGELDQADEALVEAEGFDEEEPRVRELRALWHLQRAHTALVGDDKLDPKDLEIAEAIFLDLRLDMKRRGLADESGAMLSRAVETRLVGRNIEQAASLLVAASDEERRGSARLAMARQALLCARPELALELVRAGPSSDAGRAIEASVNIISDDPEAQDKALQALDGLLFSTDSDVRVEAALARVIACIDATAPAEWSDRAGEILSERDADAAEILHGRAYLAKRQFVEAEAVLRGHADKPDGLNALIDVAATKGDFDTALQRSEVRLRQWRTADAELQHARLLRGAGRDADAFRAFCEVARSPQALLPGERETAFRQAVTLAEKLKRYGDMQSLSNDALAQGFTNEDFHWGRAFARFMLSRHAEALDDLDKANVQPTTLAQAELLSRILYQAADQSDALRRNVKLSARFGRPEGLEALLIVMSANASDLDPETSQAIAKTYETFAQRFPDSGKIVQRKLPQTEEGVRRLLAEMAPPADRDREIVLGVEEGSTVTAVLAAVHRRSVSELWAALNFLPVSYGDGTLDDLELQDARKTLASPALLDPTSLSVLTLLGDDVSQAVLKALPGSEIAQATLEDADRGANPMNDPRSPAGTVVAEPVTGEPILIPIDSSDAARRAERQRAHAELARALEAEPDAIPDSEDEMERALLNADEDIDAALRTWAATVTVAARRGLALLSDDRRIRLYLRAAGLPSFGTLSLLKALVEAGDLAETTYAQARRALLAAGAVGLHPVGEEIVGLLRDGDWEPSRAIYVLLTDATFWEPDAIGAWDAAVTLLSCIAMEAPQKLPLWVTRLVDAAKQAKPHLDIDVLCFGLVATAWGWTSASPQGDRHLLQQVIAAIRDLSRYLGEGTHTDPVEYALARYANVSANVPQTQRAIIALRAMALLSAADQMRALRLLWE